MYTIAEGGLGSGNHGHKGRPGRVGGSSSDRNYTEITPGEYDRLSKEFYDYITVEQYDALGYYTRLGYSEINWESRQGNRTDLVAQVEDSMIESSQDMVVYRRTHVLPKWLEEGTEFTDKGFVSTSYTQEKLKNVEWQHPDFGNKEPKVHYQIYVPKGTKIAYMGRINENLDEGEILLNRNTRFKVLGIRGKRVDLEVIP